MDMSNLFVQLDNRSNPVDEIGYFLAKSPL